jgi:hypothetical protein
MLVDCTVHEPGAKHGTDDGSLEHFGEVFKVGV